MIIIWVKLQCNSYNCSYYTLSVFMMEIFYVLRTFWLQKCQCHFSSQGPVIRRPTTGRLWERRHDHPQRDPQCSVCCGGGWLLPGMAGGVWPHGAGNRSSCPARGIRQGAQLCQFHAVRVAGPECHGGQPYWLGDLLCWSIKQI